MGEKYCFPLLSFASYFYLWLLIFSFSTFLRWGLFSLLIELLFYEVRVFFFSLSVGGGEVLSYIFNMLEKNRNWLKKNKNKLLVYYIFRKWYLLKQSLRALVINVYNHRYFNLMLWRASWALLIIVIDVGK